MTDVRDPSSQVEQEVDANVSIQQEVGASGQKELDEERLVSGDLMGNYNYALEEDRSLRVRLRSVYCSDPYIDPTRASATKRAQDRRKYEDFKKKKTPARYVLILNISIQMLCFLMKKQITISLFTLS